ncbi:MAG: tight adherence protein [Phycisphaerales bacterium]|jgi:tight adherence protein B|nr:tight adherence protein [Phycisphaerales bacterium]
MESLYVPILTAAAVALFIWSVATAIKGVLNNEKRHLQERLRDEAQGKRSSGSQRGGSAQLPLSITRDNNEAAGASALLARWRPLEGLHRAVVQAYPNMTVATFVVIAGTSAAMMFVFATLMTSNEIISVVAAGLGAYFPFLMLGQKRARRQRQLAMQLPEALDFLARVLQAGHSFSTGIQMMSEELPDPLRSEFRRCYEQHSLGQPLEDSLKDMATRIESTDFAFFITAVLIQRQTGGDLSDVLKNISSMIRQRIRLAQHLKAKTAEGRFTGYILVAFPAVMFVVVSFLNPAYAHNLTGTTTGQKMLGLAFGLQMLGLWAIRKLTTVKI